MQGLSFASRDRMRRNRNRSRFDFWRPTRGAFVAAWEAGDPTQAAAQPDSSWIRAPRSPCGTQAAMMSLHFRCNCHYPRRSEWVDREQIKAIDRSQGVTVHWRGAADSDLILIVASNVDQLTTATAT